MFKIGWSKITQYAVEDSLEFLSAFFVEASLDILLLLYGLLSLFLSFVSHNYGFIVLTYGEVRIRTCSLGDQICSR